MNMVAHQAEGVERKTEAISAPIESVEILLAVAVVSEDCLSFVASNDDVVKRPESLESQRARDVGTSSPETVTTSLDCRDRRGFFSAD